MGQLLLLPRVVISILLSLLAPRATAGLNVLEEDLFAMAQLEATRGGGEDDAREKTGWNQPSRSSAESSERPGGGAARVRVRLRRDDAPGGGRQRRLRRAYIMYRYEIRPRWKSEGCTPLPAAVPGEES